MIQLFLIGVTIIGFVITFWAQWKVRRNFSYWSKVESSSQWTGAEVARYILDKHGLFHVPVQMVGGQLTDHYDPTVRAVRLSESVYGSTSVAAISVAAHECGHAIQHQEAYGALVFRHRMVPLLQITSGMAPILLLVGLFLKLSGLFLLGLLFFSVVVLFHLVTLPVEFNASSRASNILLNSGIIQNGEEKRGVRLVLGAAALTYVAGALVAILELAQYLLLFLFAGGNDE